MAWLTLLISFDLFTSLCTNVLILLLDNGVKLFHERMDSLERQEREELGRQEGELYRNQHRQEEIRRELRELEEEEKRLTHDIRTIQEGLRRSSQARDKADKGIEDWKGKIEGLEGRTDTALNIMTHMKGQFVYLSVCLSVCLCLLL